jgi:phosphoribosylglycinamide formyltransferase-1
MIKKVRIGALISGGGTNLQAVIDACESEKIDAEMVSVGSDNPEAFGLQRAQKHHIPTFVADYRAIIRNIDENPGSAVELPLDADLEELMRKQTLFSGTLETEKLKRFMVSRVIAEAALLREMDAYRFDLVILAGFMRNLTPYFIDKVNRVPKKPRIMNIHPALLPSFPGVDGYGDTFRYGCRVGGCTVHFIDYGEDSGPIIGQKAFPIEPTDTLARIKEKGLNLEWELYPECIQLFAEGRIRIVQKTFETDTGKPVTRSIAEILPRE